MRITRILRFCDGADGAAVVTAVVVAVLAAAVEAEDIGAEGVVRVERTGPIIAIVPLTVEVLTVAVALSGKKYRIAVLDAGDFITID